VRAIFVIAALVLTNCGPDTAPAPPRDVTTEAWYGKALAQLTGMNSDAEAFLKSGKPDDASALIERGEPIASQLLGVPRPTLAAMEAASDLDDLYGRMLLSNRHYEWAQFQFQKNRARWKYWKPQTEETARRLQQADAAIAECDRGMASAARASTHVKKTGRRATK
jgi:hypothetical protein